MNYSYAASFSKQGMKNDMLAAFMMSSILLNPQLLVHTTALGITVVLIRFNSCILVGFIVGLLIHIFYKNKPFFKFDKLYEIHNKDTDSNIFLRLLKNIGRNIKATGPYFLVGIILSVLFQMYVPSDVVTNLFGNDNGYAVLLAATSFMITGPSTKITNLGALFRYETLYHLFIVCNVKFFSNWFIYKFNFLRSANLKQYLIIWLNS